MTDDEYKTYVGKLCQDKDKPDVKYMIYDIYYKLNHKGGMFPAYKYMCMNTGFLSEAPCSHFFDPAAYVRFLSASDV